MCFSAEMDLAAGSVITAIGLDTLRHARRREQLAMAALPVTFGVHQLVETLVWWHLGGDFDGAVSTDVGRWAMYAYLVIAIVVVPLLVPYVFSRLRASRHPLVDQAFVLCGAFAAVGGSVGLLQGASARIDHHHIAYSVDGVPFGDLPFIAYVVATCLPGFLARARPLQLFAVLNLVVVAGLVYLDRSAVVSLWCVWAAVTSILINLWVRRAPDGVSAGRAARASARTA